MNLARISTTNRGNLLIELCIALALASIMFVALAQLLFARESMLDDLSQEEQAIFIAKNSLLQHASTTKDYITPCLYRETASSTWLHVGNEKSVSFSLIQVDATTTKAIDADCSGTFPQPLMQQHATLTSFLIDGTSTAIDVYNGQSYIATILNGTTTLRIYDTSTAQPQLITSLPIPFPAAMIDATSQAVYIAGTGSSSQLVIVKKNNSNQLVIQDRLSLPGVAGDYPGAQSILFYNNKVFVGTHRTAGRELHVYDVSSSHAQWLGSLELNHNINALAAKDSYLYLATSGNSKDLIVVDISKPNSMKIISSLDIPGDEDSTSIYAIGDKLLLGRKKSLKTSEPSYVSLSLNKPDTPTIATSTFKNFEVSSIIEHNFFDYIWSPSDKTFRIQPVGSTTPQFEIYLPSFPLSVDIENNTAYILNDHALLTLSLK